jgi:hypothetical protein
MHTNPKAPQADGAAPVRCIEKKMVAQEFLGVRLGNYTGCEKNIFRNCDGWARSATTPNYGRSAFDQLCVRQGLISGLIMY